jgi:hypothetical protein
VQIGVLVVDVQLASLHILFTDELSAQYPQVGGLQNFEVGLAAFGRDDAAAFGAVLL